MYGTWRISYHFFTGRLIHPLSKPIHKLMILVVGGGEKRIVTKYVYTFEWTNLLVAHIKIQIRFMFLGVG